MVIPGITTMGITTAIMRDIQTPTPIRTPMPTLTTTAHTIPQTTTAPTTPINTVAALGADLPKGKPPSGAARTPANPSACDVPAAPDAAGAADHSGSRVD